MVLQGVTLLCMGCDSSCQWHSLVTSTPHSFPNTWAWQLAGLLPAAHKQQEVPVNNPKNVLWGLKEGIPTGPIDSDCLLGKSDVTNMA